MTILRRLALFAVVPLAVVVSSCSIGTPKPATYVTDVSATLNAVVSSNEEPAEVTYWFNYGTTTDYGTVTPDRTYQIPADSQDDTKYPVSEPIQGLEPNTTYHYQVCTSPGIEPGSRGCTNQDQAFTTGADGSGRSGLSFESSGIYVINADGTGQTLLPDTSSAAFSGQHSWSPDGGKIVYSRFTGTNLDLWVMDADGGNQTRLADTSADEIEPAWSPDGTKIAFTLYNSAIGDDFGGVYVMDADGGSPTRLAAGAVDPSWSPDGSRLAFSSFTTDDFGALYVMNADGSNKIRLTDPGSARHFDSSWSPDGTRIAFDNVSDGGTVIGVVETDGATQIDLGPGNFPTWSPDGSKIAFSDHSGESPIIVMDADGGNRSALTDGTLQAVHPAWSPRP